MANATVAWRSDLPLTFGFLVYRDSEMWMARSVLTSHFAAGPTPDEAIDSLTKVIDASLRMARKLEMTPDGWAKQQNPTRLDYLQTFITACVRQSTKRNVYELSGGVRATSDVAVLSVKAA